ncbi:MAG: hypothetical protein AAF934_06995 [Bacteroidota bacterium]
MKKIVLLFTCCISTHVIAQNDSSSNAKSVNSIDGILNEMLNIISGEEGKKRDWDAFKNLFLPTANFSVLSQDESYPRSLETVNLEDFIDSMKDSYYDKGFKEYELGKVVNEYNGIANVFQSFYGKDSEGAEAKGINSYQLVYFKNRWWIANMVWTFETDDLKIPKKYLKKN